MSSFQPERLVSERVRSDSGSRFSEAVYAVCLLMNIGRSGNAYSAPRSSWNLVRQDEPIRFKLHELNNILLAGYFAKTVN